MFFCTSETHPTVFRMFLPLVTKITVFTVFFASALAKTLVFIGNYLRSFQHVARSTFSMPKAQKHCNYTVNYNVSGLLFGFVEGAEGWGTAMTVTSPLLRKAKLKVAPLELPFVINFLNKFGLHPWEPSSYQAWSLGADHFLWREWGKKPLTSLIFFHLFSRWPVWPRNLSHGATRKRSRSFALLDESQFVHTHTLPSHQVSIPKQDDDTNVFNIATHTNIIYIYIYYIRSYIMWDAD